MVTRSGYNRQSRSDGSSKNEVRVIARTRSKEARENRRASFVESGAEDANDSLENHDGKNTEEKRKKEIDQINLVDGDPLKTAEAISSDSDTEVIPLSSSEGPSRDVSQCKQDSSDVNAQFHDVSGDSTALGVCGVEMEVQVSHESEVPEFNKGDDKPNCETEGSDFVPNDVEMTVYEVENSAAVPDDNAVAQEEIKKKGRKHRSKSHRKSGSRDQHSERESGRHRKRKVEEDGNRERSDRLRNNREDAPTVETRNPSATTEEGEPIKKKAPAFKVLHAGVGSWQHLDLDKSRTVPANEATAASEKENILNNEPEKTNNQIDKSEFIIQSLSSYPPSASDQPSNDYFLAQHSYSTDISVHEVNSQSSLQFETSQEVAPPLPPPEEETEVSEHYDLLLGFGLNESAAKEIDLLFTCKYLTEPLPDEVILELAELEDEQMLALVNNFKTSDLSKIRNRLVFFKARLKLLKMKGVEGLNKAGASGSISSGSKVTVGYCPVMASSNVGANPSQTQNVNEDSASNTAASNAVANISKPVSSNGSQAQTYTYMAMQRLANYDKGPTNSGTASGFQQGNSQNPSGNETTTMGSNSTGSAASSDVCAAGSNSIQVQSGVASAPYNYPNPYQDMSSVQQTSQTAGGTQANAYSNAYQGYNQNYQNYYGSYNSNYGWGNTGSPGGFGQSRQGYSNGYSSQNSNAPPYSAPSMRTGPDMSKMNEILLRTGYNYEHNHVIRKYGPPPDWVGDPPGSGHELFVGKIPTDCWEDEIIPVFEQAGKIYEVKILIDKETNMNKGFCFVCMCTKEDAKNAIARFNGYYLRQRCRIFVKYSVQFTRLFVGGIPRNKTREEIFSGFHDEVHNLADVEVISGDDGMANRGFAFLDFKTYFDAAVARKRFQAGKITVRAWGRYNKFVVEWAVPLDNPDEEAKEQSRTILVKGLKDGTTEGEMYATFQVYGAINKIFKQHHYAFVEYMDKSSCAVAIDGEKKRGGYECRIHTPIPG